MAFVLALLSSLLPHPGLAAPPSGPIDQWTQATLPGWVEGNFCQSIVVDPVNPGTLITGCAGTSADPRIKWYRSTDYGDTWTLINATAMTGAPWGFSIDPNPTRDPATPPTLYAPAGYGSFGIWKSTDGGANWNRLSGADTAYAPYNPFGPTDVYHTAILPDDPPNHVLVTYHYGFKDNPNNEGGFGESWDGGQNWVIHQPPNGVGSSHYVIPISATTWCVISQETDRGIWRTTTAGRVGGTAANKYRDGTISTNAWTKVSESHAHYHGSYTPLKIGNAWYSPGVGASEGSIWKSTDEGATWANLVPGYTWPQPLNPYLNKNVSGLAATDQFIYSNWFLGPEIARAPRANETQWLRNYTATPAGLNGLGGNPLGNASTKHLPSGHWLVFMATNNGIWRYIEPLGSGSTAVSVNVSPLAPSLSVGTTQQFNATITGTTNLNVTWSVVGSGGGSINSAGLYTAPATAGTYQVKATSVADSSKSAMATITVTAATGTSTAFTPSAMPLISRNKPAFSSSGPGTIYSGPALANDNNYQSLWFSDPLPAWIAYDLSSVPVGQRQQILVAWNAGRSLGYLNTLPNEFIQIPIDYTIETNTAAGGTTTAPTTGWQTAVTVTGNTRGCRQHLIDLAGANWIRLRATASSNPAGIGIDLDVHAAPNGASDCWLFMGDSITGFAAYLFSDLPGRVNALAPDRWPVVVAGGIGGSNEGSANNVIDESLALFPGRFVTLNYGTNGGGPGFTAAMEILIQKVIAAGKTPVIPHMPWSDIPDQLAKAPSVNAQIDALYLKYPAILRGPDLYAAFQGRTDWIPSGDVHPNDAGQRELRRLWALAMTATNTVAPSSAIITITVSD